MKKHGTKHINYSGKRNHGVKECEFSILSVEHTEIELYMDMECGVFTCDHERMSTGSSAHKAIKLFFKNIPHVSSLPQSPEAHRTGREQLIFIF